MSLLTAIAVSATGLTAQRKRLEVLVSNLANANTTQPEGMEPYRRKERMSFSVPYLPADLSALNFRMRFGEWRFQA